LGTTRHTMFMLIMCVWRINLIIKLLIIYNEAVLLLKLILILICFSEC